MAPLQDFQIQWVNGRRLLRFTAMMVNVGAGHFEVRGRRSSTARADDDPAGDLREELAQLTDRRQVTTQAVAKYAGDGHDHWHVQEMMRYDLWGENGGRSAVRRSASASSTAISATVEPARVTAAAITGARGAAATRMR